MMILTKGKLINLCKRILQEKLCNQKKEAVTTTEADLSYINQPKI